MIVSAGFHQKGGQSKAVAALANYLATNDHPVHLVGHEFEDALVHAPNSTLHQVKRPFSNDFLGNIYLARAGKKIASMVTRANPQARVVVNGGNCDWGDINWVHYLHSAFQPDLSHAPFWFRMKERLIGGWYRKREQRIIRSARIVIANSQRTRDDIIHYIGVPESRVKTVYYGCDPTWTIPSKVERQQARKFFNLDATRPIVVFVGGFGYDNRKGFDVLIEAWKVLCQLPDWDAQLLLAGGGNASSSVQRMIAEMSAKDQIRMLGFTEKVFDLLAAADLLVSPVRYEPYGLNVQEAICRGVPAIVSSCAGVAEKYSPGMRYLLIVDPLDSNDLVNRLKRWKNERHEMQSLCYSLSKDLLKQSWDRMTSDLLNVTF